ncbi:MAG: cysteine desulfurase [bacterium]|nr:cysteine desulfurase [bacterium]
MPTDTKNSSQPAGRPSSELNVDLIKADFPILEEKVNGHRLVYLDSAASSQKPQEVVHALSQYYRHMHSNIHRGLHTLAERATVAYEKSRQHVADFIGGVEPEEVIFNSGTTEAINLVARTWGEANINEGDEIVVTEMEHHANFVPWFMLAQRKKAVIRKLPITVCGHLDLSEIDSIIGPRTKLVAITHMSNVLGTINPIQEIAALAKKHGALVLGDGAQAAPHLPINVRDLGVDFYAFSAHKMMGPTGLGLLYGRRELLEAMPPYKFGGEMISKVSFDEVTFAELPHKFEAGTPNIADVVTFDAALTYLERVGMNNARQHEIDLTGYTIEKLNSLNGLEIQGPQEVEQRGGAISFTDPTIHPHDISTFLDSRGIAIRAGHHCAQPLMRAMGKVATARASLYIYNDRSDVDALVEALVEMRKYFGL